MCLSFGGFKPILDDYTDAYMVVGCFDGRKPTWKDFIYLFSLGSGGGGGERELYYGKSKLRKSVSLFFIEDKYIVMIKVGKKMSWTKQLC